MVSNIWNKDIPVEKSSYLCDDDITYFNLDKFKHDDISKALEFAATGEGIKVVIDYEL